MQAKINVTLKDSILDPQGTAVKKALNNLEYSNVKNVRIGKLIQIELDTNDKAQAETQLKEICEKLLSNPVIENYSYTLEG